MVSPDYRVAIDAIRAARVECGLSQRELARRLQKPPSFVNKIEKLERRLDILEFITIADAIGIDPCRLLKTIRASLPERIQL